MSKIKNARFMRAMEANGKVIAEVEFSMELNEPMLDKSSTAPEQKFIAVLESNEDSSYHLRQIFKNDSDMEIDWYDNAQHEAYVDVTSSMFGDSRLNMDRESFVLDVLDHEGVRVDMESGRGER